MSLSAISPIDGRYHAQTAALAEYFSEQALMRYRAVVEIEYVIALSQIGVGPKLTTDQEQKLRKLAELSPGDLAAIKHIEQRTVHDVKALEYFLRDKVEQIVPGLGALVHFALTSEDINNIAYAMMIRDFLNVQYHPALDKLQTGLRQLALTHAALPMLGRTHGQPAAPTTLGKELAVFVHRLQAQFPLPQLTAKLNGAVGNFNAHTLVLPNINWLEFSEQFVTGLGFKWQPLSTQILAADALAALFHQFCRINTILITLARDIWWYCSHGILLIAPVDAEVGSSTMPHKVNPIMFENAEGNLLLSNSLLTLLANTLPTSRLQRDLVGSTLQRNIGVAFAHAIIALQNLMAGLARVVPDIDFMSAELDHHPEVLAEAIQTALRLENNAAGYEQLKQLTRGKKISLSMIREFVQNAKLSAELRNRLLALTPAEYTGLAEVLCRYAVEHAELH